MPSVVRQQQPDELIGRMQIPILAYFTSASQLLPIFASLRHGRSLPTARRWIVAFAVLGLVGDAVQLQFALRKIQNIWMGYISGPILVVTALIALSHWHSNARFRRGLWIIAGGFVLTVVLLVLSVEDTTKFSLIRRPLESFLVVSAALFTLLVLIREEQQQLFQQDWFWICLGLALRYGGAIAIDPVARLLIGDSGVVSSALLVRQVINAIAYVIIARGIWCPILPQRSSGRSSPASSPSFSSSPH